jgi:hypothetical protein
MSELAVADGALFSFFGEDLPRIDRKKPQWDCTGEYFKKLRPDVYAAVLAALAEPGVSWRSICRAFHVSYHTLASIYEKEQPNLATQKRVIFSTITRGLRLCAERVEELAPEMSAKDAIIGTGVLTEKMQLLAGEATSRVEVRQSSENLFDQLAKLHQRLTEDAGRVIGLAGENVGAKGALPGVGSAGAVAALPSAGSDVESPLLAEPVEGKAESSTLSSTLCPPADQLEADPDRLVREGGRGSDAAEGAGQFPTSGEPPNFIHKGGQP